jgi:flavin-dependent dehydrogenase
LIERSDYEAVRPGETLPPAIRNTLCSLGVWDDFLADHHSRSFGIHSVWGQDHLYINDFICNPYGSGWHVDRARFDAMLGTAAEGAGASTYRGARLLSCERDATNGWRIVIRSSDQVLKFSARILVDATGRAAMVARRHGAKRISYDHLVGIVGFYREQSPSQPPSQYTLVEAVDDGWWYSAMLPNGGKVVAYMTDADLYSAHSKSAPNYLQKQLEKGAYTASRLDGHTLESGPWVSAANSSRIDRAAGSDWLAVGDAAWASDPLSSQGVQVALQSGMQAAQAIERHLNGDTKALSDYALGENKNFAEYLVTRNRFYELEQRWPRSHFWIRRQAGTSTVTRSYL